MGWRYHGFREQSRGPIFFQAIHGSFSFEIWKGHEKSVESVFESDFYLERGKGPWRTRLLCLFEPQLLLFAEELLLLQDLVLLELLFLDQA